MKKLIGSLAIILVLILASTVWYFFNKPQRSVIDEDAIQFTAGELFRVFSQEEARANQLYLDKAILVSGTILDIIKNQQGQTTIVLDAGDPIFGVSCTLKSPPVTAPEKGQPIVLKGICSGFTNDVVLRDCIVADR